MSIGEALSKGFSTARKSLDLVMIVFVFSAIFSVLNIYLAPPGSENRPFSPALAVAAVIFILLTIYFQAGTMVYIQDKVKTGSAGLANFFSGGGKFFVPIFLLGLLIATVVGVFVLLAAVAVGFFSVIAPFMTVPTSILFAALGIYFVVLMFLAPYAVVVDKAGIKTALGMSARLVKKNILSLLGITLVVIAIGFGVGMVLGGILAAISLLVKNAQVTQLSYAVLSSLVNSFLGLFVTCAFMHFYLTIADRNNN